MNNLTKQFFAASFLAASSAVVTQAAEPSRWSLGEGIATAWKIEGSKLPHQDFIEQGGRRVGQKVWYSILSLIHI